MGYQAMERRQKKDNANKTKGNVKSLPLIKSKVLSLGEWFKGLFLLKKRLASFHSYRLYFETSE